MADLQLHGIQDASGLFNARQVYICVEGVGVLLLDLDQVARDPAARLWTWRAGDSPEILPEHLNHFRGEDECKPVLGGACVLVSSSWDGGVALIRRPDKQCLFYALACGAHSAEIIDGRFIAAILSNETGQLRLYDLGRDFQDHPLCDPRPAWAMDTPYGHGVVWDAESRVLYALSDTTLFKLTIDVVAVSAKLISRFPLPKPGGHDLLAFDEGRLAVSVGNGCHLFDKRSETFAPLPGLADKGDVKCISRHPQTGQVLYVQALPGMGQSNILSFVGADDLKLPYKLIYKARWNLSGE